MRETRALDKTPEMLSRPCQSKKTDKKQGTTDVDTNTNPKHGKIPSKSGDSKTRHSSKGLGRWDTQMNNKTTKYPQSHKTWKRKSKLYPFKDD